MLISHQDILIRLCVASILGGIVGIERNIHGRPAGLRTHLLVSLGSSTFMVLSVLIPHLYPLSGTRGVFFSDPARIAAQIVTGIGFLGAGVIIKDGLNIRGLTTAACLWATAGIGMAAGAGLFFVAIVATLIALIGLVFFPWVEKLYKKDYYYMLTIVFSNRLPLEELLCFIQAPEFPYRNFEYERNFETQQTEVQISLSIKHKEEAPQVMDDLVKRIEQKGLPLISLKWFAP